MTVLAVVAWVSRNDAVEQATRSRSGELAAQAMAMLATDPERSVRLAVASARTDETAEAEDALRTALTESHVKAVLRGSSGWVYRVVFSRDGARVATASQDGVARVWDAAGRPVSQLRGHKGWLSAVAFDPEGRRVVTAGVDGSARIWDARTGGGLHILRAGAELSSAVFDPRGELVLTGGWDGMARVWDARTGKQVEAIATGHRAVRGIAFSRDGSRFVTAGRDGSARVWSRDTWRRIATLGRATIDSDGEPAGLFAVDIDSTGRRVVTGGEDNTARIWAVRTGRDLGSIEHRADITVATFSPDGRHVLTAASDGSAAVSSAATGEPETELRGHQDRIEAARFDPADGRLIVTASHDGTARVWEAATGEVVAVLRGHRGFVLSADFDARSESVATAGQDGTARLWRVPLGHSMRVGGEHAGAVNRVDVSRDGSLLITAAVASSPYEVPPSRAAYVWSNKTGRRIAALRNVADLRDARFDSRGTLAATAGDDGFARVWRARTGELVTRCGGPHVAVVSLSFGADDALLASARADGSVRLCATADGASAASLPPREREIRSVAFSPDGRYLAIAGAGLWLWEHRSDHKPKRLAKAAVINHVEFSRDGRWLLAAGENGRAVVWDADRGRAAAWLTPPTDDSPSQFSVAQVLGQRAPLLSAHFNHDATLLETVDGAGPARLWTRGGRLRAELGAGVQDAQFSEDGRWLATAQADGTARVFDVTTDDQRLVVRRSRETLSAVAFDPKARSIVTGSSDGIARISRCPICGPVHDLIEEAVDLRPAGLTSREQREYTQP